MFQDEEFEEIDMGEQRVKVGFYCGELRKRLFQEHLGLPLGASSVELSDPVSAHFYHNIWQATASSNTDIFEKVYNHYYYTNNKVFDCLSVLLYIVPKLLDQFSRTIAQKWFI